MICDYNGVKISDGMTPFSQLPYINDNHENEKKFMELNDQLTEKEYKINNMVNMLNELTNKVNRTVSMVHNCRQCGAKLEIEENKPIFHCKYCGTTYIVGAINVNAIY